MAPGVAAPRASRTGDRAVTPVVRAAGGVVLRDGPDGREVLLIHRRRYGDWTLPKGKCEPDELDEDCALRARWRRRPGLVCELLHELALDRVRRRQGTTEAGALLGDAPGRR